MRTRARVCLCIHKNPLRFFSSSDSHLSDAFDILKSLHVEQEQDKNASDNGEADLNNYSCEQKKDKEVSEKLSEPPPLPRDGVSFMVHNKKLEGKEERFMETFNLSMKWHKIGRLPIICL